MGWIFGIFCWVFLSAFFLVSFSFDIFIMPFLLPPSGFSRPLHTPDPNMITRSPLTGFTYYCYLAINSVLPPHHYITTPAQPRPLFFNYSIIFFFVFVLLFSSKVTYNCWFRSIIIPTFTWVLWYSVFLVCLSLSLRLL